MLSHIIFKPTHHIDIAKRVLSSFCQNFLQWGSSIGWSLSEVSDKPGWYEFIAEIQLDEGSDSEELSETVWHLEPITSRQMTDDMFVLLVEYGVAKKYESLAHYKDGRSQDRPEEYNLEDVELTAVIAALSEVGSHVFQPYGLTLHMFKVGTSAPSCGAPKRVSMSDWIIEHNTLS